MIQVFFQNYLEQKQKILTSNLPNILKKDTFFKCLFLVLLFSSPALAVEDSNNILALIQNGLKNWIPTVKTACLYVFFALATINLVWTFGMMALRGFELGEFLAELVKKILYIGIFIFLFNVDYWLNILFDSFSQLATNVSAGVKITPNNIIDKAIDIVLIIINSLGFSAESFFKIIAGFLILIAFVFMAIDLLLVYIKFYLINIVAFFALALGGLVHFKQIGLNPILTAIKVGVELFVIQALMALAITSIQVALNQLSKEVSFDLILQTLVMSMIFAVITKLVPTLIEAVFQGTIGDSSAASAGFKAVAAMTAGMAAGMASMTANATAGTLKGTVGATKAMKAASALHFAEGGKGGMDAVKGISKNIASSAAESWKENIKGKMSNPISDNLQEKATNALSKNKSGISKHNSMYVSNK